MNKTTILSFHYLFLLRWIGVIGISFVCPFLFSHYQIPLGILINAMLFFSVMRLGKYEQMSVILLPNLAVLMRGILFGQLTMYLLYFTPFIWVGNWLLTYMYSRLQQRHGFFISSIIAGITKSAFLFCVAYICIFYRIVPMPFLFSMGYMQCVTSLGGAFVAYMVMRVAYDSSHRRI